MSGKRKNPVRGSSSASGGANRREHEPAPDPNNPMTWPEYVLPNMGITLPREYQVERWNKIRQRTLVNSRYICKQTLRKLGLYDEVKLLADQLGIWNFLTTKYPTYRKLTYEFLGTYHCAADYSSITFNLGGVPRTLTNSEINVICGFPELDPALMEREAAWANALENPHDDFLEMLIGGPKPSNTWRANLINHPSLRYLQRAMGFNIFARGETAACLNEQDTYFLYCMLEKLRVPDMQTTPCVGTFMIRHIWGICKNRQTTGEISIGGFVTRLARHFRIITNVDPPFQVKIGKEGEEIPVLDMDYLRLAHMIRKRGNTYYHVTSDKKLVPLPLPPIDANNPATWVAPEPEEPEVPPENVVPPPQLQPQQAYPNQPDVMTYLVNMNTAWTARFNTLETNYTSLSEENAALRQQVTQLSTQQNTRFDDVYRFHDYAAQQLHDQGGLIDRMYDWHLNSGHINPRDLPDRVRRPTSWPFDFDATTSTDATMGDAPPDGGNE